MRSHRIPNLCGDGAQIACPFTTEMPNGAMLAVWNPAGEASVFDKGGILRMHSRFVVPVLLFSILITAADFAHSQADQKAAKGNYPVGKPSATCGPKNQLSSAQFQLLLQTVREAWLAGQAERVVECFVPGAILSLPPSRGVVGRDSLLQVFGTGPKTEPPKSIEWHHVIFDADQQIGAVEFSMQRHIPSHGVIIIKVSGGLISNWRQYMIASDLTWEKFIGLNEF
jgi:hypothetical protein